MEHQVLYQQQDILVVAVVEVNKAVHLLVEQEEVGLAEIVQTHQRPHLRLLDKLLQ
jgi:hypothetical protein